MTGQGSAFRVVHGCSRLKAARCSDPGKPFICGDGHDRKRCRLTEKSLITRKPPASGGGLGRGRVSVGAQTYALARLADVILAGVRMVPRHRQDGRDHRPDALRRARAGAWRRARAPGLGLRLDDAELAKRRVPIA